MQPPKFNCTIVKSITNGVVALSFLDSVDSCLVFYVFGKCLPGGPMITRWAVAARSSGGALRRALRATAARQNIDSSLAPGFFITALPL